MQILAVVELQSAQCSVSSPTERRLASHEQIALSDTCSGFQNTPSLSLSSSHTHTHAQTHKHTHVLCSTCGQGWLPPPPQPRQQALSHRCTLIAPAFPSQANRGHSTHHPPICVCVGLLTRTSRAHHPLSLYHSLRDRQSGRQTAVLLPSSRGHHCSFVLPQPGPAGGV